MGRQHAEGHSPFRFLLNHSQAIATNVYLLLYPRPFLHQRLVQQPELIKRVWQSLNAISATTLLKEGRVYGDGLHKLEPKELAHVLLDRFPTHL
jgi:adenine-specific DNA-methyltransferase